jgi:hypothetical protein
MNLFKARHRGDVKSDNRMVSLYLTSLFNNTEIVGSYILLELLKYIDSNSENSIGRVLNLPTAPRLRTSDFNKRFMVKASLFSANGLDNFIDINIHQRNKVEGLALNLVLDNNLSNQFETDIYAKLLRKKSSVEIPSHTLLITKDNEGSFEYFKNLVNDTPHISRLKWSDFELNSNSLISIFKNFLKLESVGEIAPLHAEQLYQVKCFIDYIELEFIYKASEVATLNVKEYAHCMILDGTCYMIKKYDDNSIRLFDGDDNLLSIKVKPKLREMIADLELPVELDNKTTNELGRDVIRSILSL